MDNDKVHLLEELIHNKLHPFTTNRVLKRDAKTVLFAEITLKFQDNKEVDSLIEKLQLLK